MSNFLHGRKILYTGQDELTRDNVLQELRRVLGQHSFNALAEDELYWYARGIQPILNRTKERNNFVCNKIVINFANQAVTFRNGYFLTRPATYIGRNGADIDKVAELNSIIHNSGKHQADNKIVNWFHTVGVGILYVEPNFTDREKPFKCYALDPRSAAVVRSLNAGNEPRYCFNIVVVENSDPQATKEVVIDVYTKTKYFKLKGGFTNALEENERLQVANPTEIVEERTNFLGMLPMVEYYANENRTACFEMAIPAMNEYNSVESDRADGVEQFIQSLLVLLGVDVDEGVDADYIKKNGMLCLPFVNDRLPDVKIIAEQLNQAETQTTLNSLKDQIHAMCGMPLSVGSGHASFENVGAAYMDRGYAVCDTINRNTIDCWSESNAYATDLFLTILSKIGFEMKSTDIDINFPPNEIDNLLVRTQSAMNLKQIGLAPELILTKTGLSSDPISDIKVSAKYIDQVYGENQEKTPFADKMEVLP